MKSKKIIVPLLSPLFPSLFDDSELQAFDERFDQLGRPLPVDCRPWKNFPERPEVSLRIVGSEKYLIVKFYVREKEILGRYEQDNDPVYQDSCVEIFLSPEGKDYYYNFEFNCLGQCLAQVGPDRKNRTYIDPSILKGILRVPSLERKPCRIHANGPIHEVEPWSLLVAIPTDCFVEDDFESLKGQKFKGNFYKCGDDLSVPHYLSWNWIETDQPDFHRPDFFGEIWLS